MRRDCRATTSSSSGTVSQTTCERMPAARPAASGRERERAGRSGANEQPLHEQRRGKPGHVAERPRRGDPHERRRQRERAPRRPASRVVGRRFQGRHERAEQRHQRERQQRARHDAEQAQREHLGFRRRRSRSWRQDEDRIARRMRLMLGDVEVADAEREIDRVEVLERAGRYGRWSARNASARAAATARDAAPHRDQPPSRECANVGCSSRPSFRLPVRYPWRSMVT